MLVIVLLVSFFSPVVEQNVGRRLPKWIVFGTPLIMIVVVLFGGRGVLVVWLRFAIGFDFNWSRWTREGAAKVNTFFWWLVLKYSSSAPLSLMRSGSSLSVIFPRIWLNLAVCNGQNRATKLVNTDICSCLFRLDGDSISFWVLSDGLWGQVGEILRW